MTEIRLSVAIMTHPRRLAMAEALAERLGCQPAIALDPEPDGPPSSSRSAAVAWGLAPAWATHHLVLQDDAQPAPGFLPAVREAVAAHPEIPVSLYAHWNSWNGALARLALRCGRAGSELIPTEHVPTVALVMPRPLAADFAGFAARVPAEVPDDEAVSIFARRHGLRGCLVVPNLVEHAGVESLAGNDRRDEERRSACFLPERPSPAAGILRVAEVPVLPFLRWGEPAAVVEDVPGRWITVSGPEALWALGLDEEPLWDGCARAVAALPAAAAGLAAAASGRLLSSLWLTGYLEGAVLADLGADPTAAGVRSSTRSLVLGGLGGRGVRDQLRRHLDALVGLADRATELGAAAPRGERIRMRAAWQLEVRRKPRAPAPA
ncbi:MAG: hypothetical protein E6J41_11565 [Chloroflexi bacterium]|nr:MAG: hypothetical protein E6J41_11565 [Chloroflexota bacterium]